MSIKRRTGVSRWMCVLAMSMTATMPTRILAQSRKADLAITFTTDRTNAVRGQNVWLKGGSAEVGLDAWHGLGIAARVTGITTDSLGSQNLPLSLMIVTFGPRYRWSHHAVGNNHGLSLYGETLFGEANGLKSIFASASGVTDSANGFAVQAGGGVDWGLNGRLSYRILDAHVARTNLPNGTSNVENHFQLGTGLAIRF